MKSKEGSNEQGKEIIAKLKQVKLKNGLFKPFFALYM